MATDLSVWQERWQALDSAMADLAARYGGMSGKMLRMQTWQGLIQSLRAFSDAQFHFFYNGFGFGAEQSYKLEVSKEFPPEHVFAVILHQIGFDLETIQRLADQRVSGTPAALQILYNADKLAWDAVKPGIKYELLREETTAVTYFQKDTSIRLIPYAPVALIGIPFSSATVSRDFLAIAHEVGHYVFRHRVRPARQPQANRNLRNPSYNEWEEEIFADVYGCLIAGPILALDFQDLQLEFSAEGFLTDDGKHPTPILRPGIHVKVLERKRSTANQWGELAKVLDERWNAQLDARANERQFTHREKLSTQQVHKLIQTLRPQSTPSKSDGELKAFTESLRPITEAISPDRGITKDRPVDRIINRVLQQLAGIQSDWSGDLTGVREIDQLNRLYERFDRELPNLLNSMKLAPPNLDPTTDISQIWNDWVKREKFFGGSLPPQAPKEIHSGTTKDLGAKPNGTWIHVFQASGWTTDGPKNEPPN